MALLGARIRFESNDRRLLKLADEAFAGLPPHRLRPAAAPELRIALQAHGGRRAWATPGAPRRRRPAMQSGAGLLAGAPETSSFVALSPHTRVGARRRVGADAALPVPHALRADRVRGLHARGAHARARRAPRRLRGQRRPRRAAHGRERRGQVDAGAALPSAGARLPVGRRRVRPAGDDARDGRREFSARPFRHAALARAHAGRGRDSPGRR